MTRKNLRFLLGATASFALLAGCFGSHEGAPSSPPNGVYIVVLKHGGDPDQLAAAVGAIPRHVYRDALVGFAAPLTPAALTSLSASPLVAFVEPDAVVHATAQTVPTGIRRIGALESTAARIDGIDERVDVDVAIIDTGIDADHPDLNVAGGVNCAPGSSWDDGNGHGSHVAGTIGAIDNTAGVVGVAPGARLWAVRVLNNNGSGFLSDVVCGIDWVTAHAATIEVANMSLGGTGADDGNCGASNGDSEHQAICRSVAAGVTYVVAAGNEYADAAGSRPAAYDEVITVSALADFDGLPGHLGTGAATSCNETVDDSFACFSNYGADVDVIAPGVSISSTWKGGGYATISGTSMASPHVAGAAALWRAGHPAATPAEVRTALLSAGDATPCEGPSGTCTVVGTIAAQRAAREDPDGVQEPGLIAADPPECASAGECDDADACTADSCGAGACAHTSACDDGDACTVDACDAATGACSTVALACADDGNACTIEGCDPASGCTATPVACPDDADACTVESCDPATGACGVTPASCDDGNACTTDGCDPATGCTHVAVVCDDDGNLCTVEACAPASGACTSTPLTCDDGVACTTDACAPATGACTHDASSCPTCRPVGGTCASNADCCSMRCRAHVCR